MKKVLLSFLYLIISLSLFAQPANDDCSNLIDLGQIPICPAPNIFSNVNATGSEIYSNPDFNTPTCFNGGTSDNDVWFAFNTGDVLDIEIKVTGVMDDNEAILQPQVALYRGNCMLDGLAEIGCATALLNESSVSLEISGLTPNQSYFLRIEDWSATAAPNWGDFELCIKEPDQVFNMGEEEGSNSSSGILYDSGGPDNNYSDFENNIFTICPNELTNCISLDLVNVNIENTYDFLNIYAGESTNAPLIASFTGLTDEVSLQAGSSCVTVEFTSDNTVNDPGFELTWDSSPENCMTTFVPCQSTESIFFLPYADNNASTCNSGDDIQSGPCNDEVLLGEDVVYTYTSFTNECFDIKITGANPNTGLSVYNNCPEDATMCLGFAQNAMDGDLVLNNIHSEDFETIYIVVSHADCTDYNLEISPVECPILSPARPLCEQAILLNRCEDLPEIFEVSQQSSTESTYFQTGINDGCWEGTGAAHFTWLMFQAQADGDFGFIAQNSNEFEASNINIQAWGPISEMDDICMFMENNQPTRSTSALANPSAPLDRTGLINTHPTDGTLVTDNCENSTGDGFVSALTVSKDEFYLILINDFSGNIVNGGIQLDFSPTSEGVLNGLAADSPLNNEPYATVGTAFYNPQDEDFSCIQVTANSGNQSGCAWQADWTNFSESFTHTFTTNFGDNDAGADGLCLVYQHHTDGLNTCGGTGVNIGIGGIENSFIIEFDTWQNADIGDPFEDHVAVNVNGNMGAPISGPVPLGNIEDGLDHEITFTWDATTNTYQVFFDGTMQLSGVFDVVANCFDGSFLGRCGFTGSTGGATNLQYVCTGESVYATTSLDSTSVTLCDGESLFVGGANQTVAGIYTDVFVAENGCDSTVVTDLIFRPSSQDTIVVELCEGESYFAGGATQTTSGLYNDTFVSSLGCDSIIVTDLTFMSSSTDSIFVNLCEGDTYFVAGSSQTMEGIYTDIFDNENGCDSTVITTLMFLPITATIAIPEDIDCQNNCVELDASASTTGSNITYQWVASGTGMVESGANTPNPTVCGEGTYVLTLSNSLEELVCGAIAEVDVQFDENVTCDYGIPNVFTPNNDQANDQFELIDAGGNFEVLALKIYNRWGQLVHEGAGSSHAWNGFFNNEQAPSDVYIYYFEIKTVISGEVNIEKGDVTLVR